MIKRVILKNGKNILLTGVAVLLSTIATQYSKEMARETIENIAMDVRYARNLWRESRSS